MGPAAAIKYPTPCAMPDSALASSVDRVRRTMKVRPRIMLAPLPKPNNAAHSTAKCGSKISPSKETADTLEISDTTKVGSVDTLCHPASKPYF